MGTGLLQVDGFRGLTVMAEDDVDYLEQRFPGWLQAIIDQLSSWIEARLRKRYAVPFDRSNPPSAAVGWLVDLVTMAGMQKRGYDREKNPEFAEAAQRARDEVKEAADSNEGLFDLPLREDIPGTSGISKGGPYAYSEQSPYEWVDAQAEALNGRR